MTTVRDIANYVKINDCRLYEEIYRNGYTHALRCLIQEISRLEIKDDYYGSAIEDCLDIIHNMLKGT